MKTVEHYIEKFVPENYNVFLDINRQEKVFSGNIAISGEALEHDISFHQKDLTIHSVLLDNEILNFEMDNSNEALHISLSDTGSMTLVIEFSGKITDNMTGMYPSYYTLDGVKKEVISTQFESHFAREVFPCIDEPEAKATFDLSLKFDQVDGEIALSNMPEINEDRRLETGLWSFDTTPRMSSYLLAFAVGELQGKTAKTKNGTEVGIFSTKAHPLSSLDFSLDIAVRVIDFYEDYYGVKYPIPLSYHIALPDFSSGAMENWGLVTYREIYLLVDENSTFKSRQTVALVVAHELAHQWFGNLVTMKWWDDLWLNESFANMMEYVSVDAIEPEWKIFEDFQTVGVPLALDRDATDGVQSVHVEVNHPDEINTLFDPAIVYAKGSRLMHMLKRWLGDEAFSKGLTAYFEKYQYSNTVGNDLWHILSTTSGKDVASFMHSWLEQPGYPVVSVAVEDDTLKLEQKQFFVGEGKDKNRIWSIPLNTNWEGLPDLFDTKTIEIPNYTELAKTNQSKGPLLLNTGNTAHYIVNYKTQVRHDIFAYFKSFDDITKLQIITNYILLAKSREINFDMLVELLPILKGEQSYLVLDGLKQIVTSIGIFFDEDSEENEEFKNIIKNTVEPAYHSVGFKKKSTDSDDDELVRRLVIDLMLTADDQDIAKSVDAVFEEYRNNIENIPAYLRVFVLNYYFKNHETTELVDLYFDTYIKTNDSNLRAELAAALSQTKSQETLERVLSSLKDKDIIKPQDLSMRWYLPFLSNEFTQGQIWQWAQDNWSWIKQTLGGDMSFDKFVIYPSNVFKTEERLAEYSTFFEPQLDDMAISRNITMGIKAIQARVDLIQDQRDYVYEALKRINKK